MTSTPNAERSGWQEWKHGARLHPGWAVMVIGSVATGVMAESLLCALIAATVAAVPIALTCIQVSRANR